MASPGYTAVVASNLRDASGTLITNATAVFTPNQSFRTGDPHGQTVIRPISVPVTNGSLSTTLADTSISNPANVSYRLAVTDNLSGDVLLAKGYTQLQPSGSQWSLDDYVIPVDGPLVLKVAGQNFNVRGQWAANTNYSAYDVVTYAGSSYVVSTSFASGDTFNASNLKLLAAAGQTSFANLATQAGIAVKQVEAHLGLSAVNLADPNAYISQIPAPDGSLETIQGYGSMPFRCSGMAKVTSNIPNGATGPFLSVAFYDAADNLVGGVPCPTVANQTFSVPAAAVRGLAFTDTSAYNPSGTTQWKIVEGTTMPSGNLPYTYTLPENTNLTREHDAIVSVVRQSQPDLTNLFIRSKAVLGGAGLVTGDVDTTGVTYYYTFTLPVIAGRSYTIRKGTTESNGAYGDVWFDINGKVAGYRSIPRPDNTTIVAPAGAVNLRITAPTATIADQSVAEGTTAPAPASSLTLASMLPTNGMKYAVFGDSISSIFNQVWQSVVSTRLGVSLVYQDARPGRAFHNLFESYGATDSGQALGNYDGAAANGVGNSYFNAGKVQDQSFSSNLNNAAPNFGIIRLGTNDYSRPLGTLGDATTALTLAGDVRFVIETIQTARPMRLFGIGPAWNGFASYSQMVALESLLQSVYEFYSIPYLSMLKRGYGNVINNAQATGDSSNPAYTLTSSNGATTVTTQGFGTHPSTWAQTNVDGPTIANFAALYL